MEITCSQRLCQILICSAVQRCRISDQLCRLSVVLKRCPDSDPPVIRVSISDTGIGSCLQEFQGLIYRRNHASAEKWDGMLFITTTSISDNEIFHYHLNFKESAAARRLTRLPSTTKNGLKFSGTEVSLSTWECIDDLVEGITCFFQKKVAVELVVERMTGSRENFLLAKDDNLLPCPMSNIECLALGFQDYVLKHGNMFDKQCPACLSRREHLKVGSGVACSSDSLASTGQLMEAVVIFRELPDASSLSCLRECSTTKVIYFQDFLPSVIPQSPLNALRSIDWENYGLTIKTYVVGESGHAVIEWENLPPSTHIDIVLHCYHKKVKIPRTWQKTQVDRNLAKKAVKLALDNLKERYKGTLLSAHAVKICSYALDLARTISNLILLSNDKEFQGECLSLLGLQPQQMGEGKEVEDCIQEKIIAVIEINDRKSRKSRNAPDFLFEAENIHEPEDEEFQGEEGVSILDL
ncbi:PREDICTED: type 2 DNA topoisomerase 6 subunit B-like isoform X2 [Nelumbo nucifera]|uniref:Type 2 DNA topoisomerase 6 subunit B-like isoform X2 n=1 Tax=Nelumbo nucifera TaxID=4432 RepID=A0A1U7ZCD5_NELNU|nr:PREDICTED: type 2 DNA topoisomerase 6 subunit B-like isoform X2 [Nelumbo nucifera]